MIPDFLINELKKEYGDELASKIISGYSKKRPTTFRVNTIKATEQEIGQELEKNKVTFKKYEYIPNAYIIEDEQFDIEQTDIYKDGKIYLQSISSMLPPIILEPLADNDILDMAAAPGGKTTQIAALTNNQANITACEMNNIRVQRLKYNIEKQGATSVYVMQEDSRKINDFFSFDQILLDAPCSGSGTLNFKNQDLEKTFTTKLIQKSIKAQTSLLEKAIKILKSGNEMVYSTCSILQEENEDRINEILKKSHCEIVPIEFEGMEELPILPTKINGTLCVCPNEYYEGFFVAKIRKIK